MACHEMSKYMMKIKEYCTAFIYFRGMYVYVASGVV
jgi:hypothetical protein